MTTIGMLVMSLAAVLPSADGAAKSINSFETAADLAAVKLTGSDSKAVSNGATDGRQALQVTFKEGEWPNVRMDAPSPWDWSGENALALDVTNPGREAVDCGIRVDDDAAADGSKHCRQWSVRIEPGKTERLALPLGDKVDPMQYGMRGLPTPRDVRPLAPQNYSPLKLEHIVALQVFVHQPKRPAVLVLDNVRLLPWKISLDKIVDEFGQFTRADWPGKLKSAGEFAERRKAEETDLAARPKLPDLDAYGGWMKAPKQRATGFFRTEKIDGKWWLITPEGHVFFSMGMDCVTLHNPTITGGREQMFSWLPKGDDPLARHIGSVNRVHMGPIQQGATFDFFACNLERKYGPPYEQPWFELALRRLPSWGFNTIANWSDHRLYGNGKVPYVATSGIGGNHARISSGSDYWGKMHDPFDPQFQKDVAAAVRGLGARIKDDPWCVGWFVDNEVSWGGWGDDAGRYGLGLGALAEAAESPAKQALLARLKEKYKEASALNQAWGTQFGDWDAILPPFKPAGPVGEAMKADLIAYVKEFARQYFTVIRDELKKADPNHLYLGCRFAWHTPEAVVASDEICDVVSFNIYQPRLNPDRLPAVKLVTKPCIIGEFHFGALDRGMLHTGLVSTPSQQARAAMYVDYLQSVADHPNFVGCHWFQYTDQPLTGRTYDGENYNIGFLTITDTPYPEMVEAARTVHAEVYSRRWAGRR